MSSSQHRDAASQATTGRRSSRRPLTLRTQLTVGIVVLITVVCGVVAVSTEIFLSRYLVAQVDNQARQVNRFAVGPERPRDEDPLPGNVFACDGGAGRFGPGQALGGLAALVFDGQVVSAGNEAIAAYEDVGTAAHVGVF